MNQHEHFPDAHHDAYSRTTFGFWMYLLSDFVLFGALFAVYAVLHKNTAGGPKPSDLLHIPFAFVQSCIMLTCSFTAGIAGAMAHRRNKQGTLLFFGLTLLLGAVFLYMQGCELSGFIEKGGSWQKSAFLSSYFTVAVTFAIHIVFALLWTLVLAVPFLSEGFTAASIRRLSCLKLFWQFLNIVWIFIFTFIYLLEVT